ncbi:hypothetical protein LEN26_011076 [Aphanomyces euteiches]|nr:hypothetical protein LEN26_011076 [Aphanomyces euteiches]
MLWREKVSRRGNLELSLLSIYLMNRTNGTNATAPQDILLAGFSFGTKAILGYLYNDCFDDHGVLLRKSFFFAFVSSLIGIGLVVAFFGYRFIKVIMFLGGIFFGAVIVYDSTIPIRTQIMLSIVTGIFCGVIALLQMKIGVFVKGFVAGFMVGHLVLTTIEPYLPISKWVKLSILGACSLVLAVVALMNERATMITGTAGLGAHLASYGGYFATMPPVHPDGQYWIAAVITGGVTIIAIVFQVTVSAKGLSSDKFSHWFSTTQAAGSGGYAAVHDGHWLC